MFDSISTWIKVVFSLPFLFFMSACSDPIDLVNDALESKRKNVFIVHFEAERFHPPAYMKHIDYLKDLNDACSEILDEADEEIKFAMRQAMTQEVLAAATPNMVSFMEGTIRGNDLNPYVDYFSADFSTFIRVRNPIAISAADTMLSRLLSERKMESEIRRFILDDKEKSKARGFCAISIMVFGAYGFPNMMSEIVKDTRKRLRKEISAKAYDLAF